MLRLTIPWEALASANQRNKRRGGRAHGWDYKASMQAIHMAALDQVRGQRPHFTEPPLWARFEFHEPDFRRRDCGNYLKGLEDALKGVAYADDWHLRDVGYLVHPPDGNPRVEIRIGQGIHRED